MCISIVKTEQCASPLISQNGVIYTKIRACVCVWGYTAYKFDFTRVCVCVNFQVGIARVMLWGSANIFTNRNERFWQFQLAAEIPAPTTNTINGRKLTWIDRYLWFRNNGKNIKWTNRVSDFVYTVSTRFFLSRARHADEDAEEEVGRVVRVARRER